jgi:hypothetical protein
MYDYDMNVEEDKVHIVQLEKAKRVQKLGQWLVYSFFIGAAGFILVGIGAIVVSCFIAGFWNGITALAVIGGLVGLGFFIDYWEKASKTIRNAERYGTKDD